MRESNISKENHHVSMGSRDDSRDDTDRKNGGTQIEVAGDKMGMSRRGVIVVRRV